MNNQHGLPARPNFSTPAQSGLAQPRAGPSQPRPPSQTRSGPSRSVQTPTYTPNSFPSQQYAGGYMPQPQYAGYGMGYQPNLSGGYPSFYPQQNYQQFPTPMSFFPPSQPQINSSGYTYSSTYTQAQVQPPNKRQRPNNTMPQEATTGGMWRNCSQPGCKFVGPSDKVETHEEDRHLIFVNGKMAERSEEEERFARRKGPLPPIQGTTITLNTPEEIEKWIAERKAKWPSRKRISEKEDERAAAIARGEVPARGQRKGKKMDAASLAEEWGKEVIPQALREGRGGRAERGSRGRGRGADRARGQGRDRGRGRGGHRGGHMGQMTESVDQGWTRLSTLPSVSPEKQSVELKSDKEALLALEGYDTPSSATTSSESDSGSESSSESESESDSETSSSSESEANQKEKTDVIKPSIDVGGKSIMEIPKEICTFAQQGTCKFGAKCKKSHEGQEEILSRKPAPRQPNLFKKPNHFARPSMLGSLLSNPIQNTISQISQTIRFLVANDMLEGVELKPGDAQKAEEEKNKVTEVNTSGA
ncbi:uncharacterized protein I206_102402 [Kwoniella pini CBS 10737]|uniref:C3H1-type domain-containing protein n=1 Tax=Kwoniella pini CBS 10737 TaxID=1296096 RepID=A0A1B9I584_9TREE|nr:uncharacterized protein I206_02749 [Kwoniella pini CBS 10737]OCF50693.1 hypothetical protein I206_02749 [Kwoniella pini CBS 10737]